MTPLPTAIFFDLDDTIVSFSSGAKSSWYSTAQQFESQLGVAADAFTAAIEVARQWFWQDPERHRQGRLNLPVARSQIITRALSQLGVDGSPLISAIGDAYAEKRDQRLHLIDGAFETLQLLHESGVRLALLTNGEFASQRGKIERFDLARFFDCIVIEEEFGVGKPDLRVFEHAMKQLNVDPPQIWMVGDNFEWEIVPAVSLGIFTVWIDGKGEGNPSDITVKPDRTIGSIAELLDR